MFFLWFIIIVVLIVALFYTLSFKLEFENFNIKIPKEKDKNSNDKYNNEKNKNSTKDIGKIKLKIYLFNLIKIADFDLKKIKKEKIKLEQIKNILKMFTQRRNKIELNIRDIFKGLNINILKFNLEITIGLKDAATTAITIGLIYSIMENILINNKKKNKNKNSNNDLKYIINPNYEEDMILIKLDSIFKFNMRNIINMLFKIVKRRVKENGTSNRKLNVFSNE